MILFIKIHRRLVDGLPDRCSTIDLCGEFGESIEELFGKNVPKSKCFKIYQI